MRERVPIVWGVEVDQLAELILPGEEVALIGRIFHLERAAHQVVLVEIGERDSRELDCSECDVYQVPFFANTSHVAEIAEEVVDVPDLQVPDGLKENDWTCATCIVLQFNATARTALFGGALMFRGVLLAITGVRIGV